ncbi:bombyxin A-2-like [Harmonia axyridis]|uniref:bombyxin A-2-like n=1 Tax=Harmonia axyridis TaxID=115357 RepID=UPI001E27877C|nr:bombyxin A-2-like [Harmonia axyridis]
MKNLAVILLIVLGLNSINKTRSSNIHSRMQYFCGTRLVVALSLICETYNNPSEVEEDYSQRNGIIETCCQRPCSRSVLASYCGSLKALLFEPFYMISKTFEF